MKSIISSWCQITFWWMATWWTSLVIQVTITCFQHLFNIINTYKDHITCGVKITRYLHKCKICIANRINRTNLIKCTLLNNFSILSITNGIKINNKGINNNNTNLVSNTDMGCRLMIWIINKLLSIVLFKISLIISLLSMTPLSKSKLHILLIVEQIHSYHQWRPILNSNKKKHLIRRRRIS
jgi:hypothetical protein